MAVPILGTPKKEKPHFHNVTYRRAEGDSVIAPVEVWIMAILQDMHPDQQDMVVGFAEDIMKRWREGKR